MHLLAATTETLSELYDAMTGQEGQFLRELHVASAAGTQLEGAALFAGGLLGCPRLATLILRDMDLSRAGDAAAIAAALEHLPALTDLR